MLPISVKIFIKFKFVLVNVAICRKIYKYLIKLFILLWRISVKIRIGSVFE